MNYALCALVGIGIVEVGMLWFVGRALRRVGRVESRLAHLTDALTLLTETAEAGFRANAAEIGRMADRHVSAPAAAPASSSRRVASAARKGVPLDGIAAREEVSEGEVSLRLHLAKAAAARRQKARSLKETGHVALRS